MRSDLLIGVQMDTVHPTFDPANFTGRGDVDSLCQLIRDEKVLLWVGSGFSKYAGYPTGRELSPILLSSLGKLPSDAPIPIQHH